jgi:AraC-like DNA-binding protein
MVTAGSRKTISTRLVNPFVRVLDQLGKETSKLQKKILGFSRYELDSPDRRISHHASVALLKESIRISGRTDFGLLAAEAVDTTDLEIWEYVLRSQPTVGHAIKSMSRLLALLHDGSRVEIEQTGDLVTVHWILEPSLERLPAINEFALGMVIVTWRRVLKTDAIVINGVYFPHPPMSDISRYEKLFRCAVHFNAPFLGIRLPAAVLDFPMPQADTLLSKILERQARDLISRLPRPGFAYRVQELVTEKLATGDFNVEKVAEQLKMSTRTLNRKLKEEGTTFRELVEYVRHHLAIRYLTEENLSVTEIAYLLGFSNASAFHKAFKRWTGTSAGKYRSKMMSRGNR